MNTRRLGRLGVFALGLGFGAAMASAGVASADPGSDATDLANLIAAIDPFGAAAASPTNIDISFDGYTIYDGGGTAFATTTPGDFDFAIAEGADARASATGGLFDYASADGTNADAVAGGTGNNFDSATDIGNNTTNPLATAVLTPGAQGAFAEGGSGNTAIDIGNNTGTGPEGAVAGGLYGTTGNNDEALTFANLGNAVTTPAGGGTGAPDAFAVPTFTGTEAVDGNNDAASIFGLGSTATDTHTVFAGDGNGDLASVVGITSYAHAGGLGEVAGNNDAAFVVDPPAASDVDGSSAVAGSGPGPDALSGIIAGNNDLAGVFGDDYHAVATGGSNIVELLPSLFGDTTTATTGTAADLTSLAGDFSSFLGDIGSFFSF